MTDLAPHTASTQHADSALYIAAKHNMLTISENLTTTAAFDRAGRLVSAVMDGATYCRALNGDMVLKQVRPNAPKLRRRLAPAESEQVEARLVDHLRSIAPALPTAGRADLVAWLDTILAWDADRRQRERQQFAAIYKPVSILPPDQYRSVVFQSAEGCSWNRCSFCTFYLDRPFRIKAPTAFRQHVRDVLAFLGQGISMRGSVFLGDANALIVPQPRLLEQLRVIHDELPGVASGARGIYSFLDIFGATRKTEDDYRQLRELGLRRVYIGMETGDDEVFALLRKPGSPAACVDAVQTMKRAGLEVGVIVLAGAGGARLADQHCANTLARLGEMQLGAGDIVYVSPLIPPPGSPYERDMLALGSGALSHAQLDAQLATIRAAVRSWAGPPPKVALYHIEEFLY